MGWDGSGNFNRTDGTRSGATTWNQADTAGVGIVSTDHDTHDEDIASGLENCITRTAETKFTATTWALVADTNDGADNKLLALNGGGARGSNRGGGLEIYGNEHATSPGVGQLFCGNVSGASVKITAPGAQDIEFQVSNSTNWTIDGTTGYLLPISYAAFHLGNASLNLANVHSKTVNSSTTLGLSTSSNIRWSVNSGGDFIIDATNGGNILFGLTGIKATIESAGSVVATGTDQTTAVEISTTIVNISSGTGGIKLTSDLGGINQKGRHHDIWNTSGVSINIYPASGHSLGNLAVNAPLALSNGKGVHFFAYGSGAWAYVLGA